MHENYHKAFHYIKCLLVSGTFTHFIAGANDCTLQKINYKAEIKQILTFQKSNTVSKLHPYLMLGFIVRKIIFWPLHKKTTSVAVPRCLLSLIRGFTVGMEKVWILSYSLNACIKTTRGRLGGYSG